MNNRPFCLLLMLVLPIMGIAQNLKPFSYEQDWNMVSSDFFDVHYLEGDRSGAIKVAKYAELARYELGVLFDFKPEFRYPVIYAGNSWRLMYTHLDLTKKEKVPGIFQLPDIKGYVVHPESSLGLYQEVKKQVALMILDEFTNTDRLGGAIQSQLLMYNADWFRVGLADFVATGWTFEDEMWMQSLASSNMNLITLAQEGNGELNRRLRKSIWHYITHEYGKQKISEIIYLANLSHSVESGIISVLGINLSTLTYRWQEYVLAQASMQAKGRTEVDKLEDLVHVLLRENEELISFAYSEASHLFALYLNKNGKQTVYIYNPESHEFTQTSIQSGFANFGAQFLDFNPPMAWSHDGNTLATTAYVKGDYKIVWFDKERQEVQMEDIPANIRQINHISWSHSNDRLAVSALNGGQIDIFTLKTGSSEFNAITNDLYDDLDPNWSMDDQNLFFSSNRPTGTEEAELSPLGSYQSQFDLFRYAYENGQKVISPITNTPMVNERKPFAVSSFELAYQSDESGIANLNKINVFLNEVTPLSNLDQGLDRFQASEKAVAFMTPMGGKQELYLTSMQAISQQVTPEPTLLRLEYTARLQQKAQELAEKIQKELPDITEPTEVLTDTTAAEESEQAEEVAVEEEQQEDDSQKAVRYYIFDEDDEPYEVNNPPENYFDDGPRTNRVITTVFGDVPKPALEDIGVSNEQKSITRWNTDYLGLNLNWDPLPYRFKIGLDLRAGFSDIFKNHKIEAQVAPFIKTTFANVKYSYLKNRIDLFAHAAYIGRTFRETSQLVSDSSFFRFNRLNLNLGAVYPLNSFAGVEASIGGYYLNRRDQQLQRQTLLNDDDQVLRAGVRLTFNNVEQEEGYRYKGIQAQAGYNTFFSIAQRNLSFHRLFGELRHYQELYKKIVLASRVTASFNIPNDKVQFYMGGVDNQLVPIQFANNEGQPVRNNSVDTSLHNFHFLDFVMPVRGFMPNTRQGSRYIVANLELRIPVSRLIRHSLNSNALYSLELIPFLDAGTVWVDGNPFSQKKPTDTQYISTGNITIKLQTLKSPFLFGFGSGVRVNLLSYSVRTDLAWGLDDNSVQRPILTVSIGKNF